ncbi:MAG: alpha/beta hydrolase, partial [Gorillibacterium sp.]|nr:alpha/beta hydrolase [Gorillibacterium sp.]
MSTSQATIIAFPAAFGENAYIGRSTLRPRFSRGLKISLALFLTLVLLLMSAVTGFYAYMLYHIQNPPVPALTSNPLRAIGLPYNDITFASRDGNVQLEGWYIPGTTQNTVILSHGYGGNREETWVPLYEIAKELNKNRFNVLMFDYSSVNPRRYVTGGIEESQELIGAIQYVKELGDQQIYIWGFSMGAGTALQAALQDSQDIRGMILDSTFLLDSDTMFHNLQQKVKRLPRLPSIFMLNLLSPLYTGHKLKEVPINLVKSNNYEMPMFLVHGVKDKVAPVRSITNFYEAHKGNPNTELWLLDDGQHELIYKFYHKEYMQKAMEFLDKVSTGG